MTIVHNCGNGIYFDIQMETMQPVAISFAYTPDDCQSMPEAKEKWGNKTCFIGYVDPATHMFLGTPEDAKEECKRQIEELKKDGGFILSTGCEFPPNLITALKGWEKAGPQARIERRVLLKVQSPDVLDKLRETKAARFFDEPLSPTTVVIKAGAWQKVTQALAELGFLAEIRLEENEQ